MEVVPDIIEMMQLVDKNIKGTIIKIIHIFKKAQENTNTKRKIERSNGILTDERHSILK